MSSGLFKSVLIVGNVFVYAVLLFPLLVVVAISFTSGAGVDFPPPGWSLRWFEYIAHRPEFISGAINSLILAIVSTLLALTLGIVASRVMGAGQWRTFREVLLPMMRPGLVVAALFAFIVSFDNFNLSIFLINGNTVTLPVRIFTYLGFQFDPSIAAISTVLLIATVAVLVIAEQTVGLTRLRALSSQ